MTSATLAPQRAAAAPSPRGHRPRALPKAVTAAAASAGKNESRIPSYSQRQGIDPYIRAIWDAEPMEVMEIERMGVEGVFIKDLSKHMGLPASRFFSILGVPKATAEKKAAAGERVSGSGGQAAVGVVKLLGIAQAIVDGSTAPEAKDFDAARWLGQWIERPQPALGGRKPADLIGTPTGLDVVARLLGAIESGAYQ
jgi:putative toxin-antitoxin system antitoxin component (TIGR02293 family)